MCIPGEIDKTTVGKSVIAYRYFTIGRSGLLRAYRRLGYNYAPPKLGRKPIYTTTDDPTLGPDMGFHAHPVSKLEEGEGDSRTIFRVRLHGTVAHHTYGIGTNPSGFRASGMTIVSLIIRRHRKPTKVERLVARRYRLKIERPR